MNAVAGTAAVSLGLAGAIVGISTLAAGLRQNNPVLLRAGSRSVWVVFASALLAAAVMERALFGHDFSLRYVAENGGRQTPPLFTFTTLWSALEGSILLWALVLGGYLTAVVRRFRDRTGDPLFGWAMVVGLAVAAFFFALMLGPANPFRVVSGPTPLDGPGPNPLLQNHPLVAFHPPMLYLGYVGFTVPFAFALASLITGRVGEAWVAETRRWALFAWGFLTVGIVLGAWWSYEVLGWGGYWAWDPVENASFLPWLTATAFLHSAIVQERRMMLRVWNLSLLIATFSLTILGTFLTRSGVLDSVHAFTESGIGPAILAFLGVVVAVSLGLLAWRGDALRAPGTIDSPASREGAFLTNNLLFAAFAFVVLLGTVFPLVAEALRGDRLSIGSPYFDRMTMPIGFTLLFLMAIAPALPWRKASAELLHRRLLLPAWTAVTVVVACVVAGRRGVAPLLAFGLGAFAAATAGRQLAASARRHGWRGLVGRANGGMVVHLGVVLIAVAFAASHSYGHRREFRLAPGQSAGLAGHHITYLGTVKVQRPNKTSLTARVRVDGGRVYAPALHQFPFASQAIGSPSVRTGLLDDVYVTLVAAPTEGSNSAVIGFIVQPLIAWLWIGGAVMAIGTALALGSERRREIVAQRPPAESPVEDATVPVSTLVSLAPQALARSDPDDGAGLAVPATHRPSELA